VTDSKTTKCFETSECRPPIRLRQRSYHGSPRTFVLLEEKEIEGWYRVGSAELGYGPTDTRGRLSEQIIAEWGHTEYHANGDRIRLGRRLRRQFDLHSLEVVLEEEREQILGSGDREEHDWQPVELFRFDGPRGEEE